VFRFANSEMLYGLIAIPLMVLLFLYAFRMKRKALSRFGNPELLRQLTASASRSRQIWKAVWLLLVLVFLITSLARPQLGTKLKTVRREGQDILIALDVSLSMTARDIQPSRLEKAKHEIASLIDRLRGDRVGLIAFAGRAFVQCPLTLDYGAARMFLDVMSPEIIPVPGTAIAEAIEKAVGAFVEKERKHKVLILITDGEEHEGDPLAAAGAAAREGVIIYTVGIGSVKGVPIPVTDERGNSIGFKKDRQDNVVMTKLDETILEKIALETGGRYYRATPGQAALTQIYDEISGMEKKVLSSMELAEFEERFQIPLGIACVLLLLEWFLPERRRTRKTWKGRFE